MQRNMSPSCQSTVKRNIAVTDMTRRNNRFQIMVKRNSFRNNKGNNRFYDVIQRNNSCRTVKWNSFINRIKGNIFCTTVTRINSFRNTFKRNYCLIGRVDASS